MTNEQDKEHINFDGRKASECGCCEDITEDKNPTLKEMREKAYSDENIKKWDDVIDVSQQAYNQGRQDALEEFEEFLSDFSVGVNEDVAENIREKRQEIHEELKQGDKEYEKP